MFSRLLRRFSTKKTTSLEPDYKSICLTSSTNDSVPLKSVSIDVRIEGFIADVRSTLSYKNVGKDPIEARYEFPMDDQSAVYQFEAQIEDRVIIAECQEKKKAEETYDEALKAGFTAVLMQEDDSSSDIFTCLVGNLPPDAEAVIKFGYVTELSLQPNGTLCFLLPTLLNPRYNPSEKSGGSPGSKGFTHVPAGAQPYSFEIKATIVNPAKIVSVKSLKDEFDVKLSEDKTSAQVTLAKPFVPDHDLVMNVTIEELNEPHVIFENGDNTKDGILKKDIVMLNFFPELKDTDYTNKQEIIFVIDRSGSMSGSRIQQAKEALLLFLKSLPPGCYFNVVGFGSNFEVLFEEGSREYCEETLKVACEHQKRMDANLGGTEILQPLKHIYDKPPMTTHCREILIMTDGEVSNTEAVISLVKRNASNSRLFSFGIGAGASTALVKGIARAGGGTAEFTNVNDRLQPLVVKTLKAAMQPTVTDLHLDWQLSGGPCELVQMPKEMPSLFAGDRLILYAMALKDKIVLDGTVQLKGKIGERSLEFEIRVDASKSVTSMEGTFPIHRLAAKAQIKQLQDSGKDDNKTLIVLLSTATNVISCHTSMVGVDKNRKNRVIGGLVRRNVPIMSGLASTSASACGYSMVDSRSLLKTKSKSFGRIKISTPPLLRSACLMAEPCTYSSQGHPANGYRCEALCDSDYDTNPGRYALRSSSNYSRAYDTLVEPEREEINPSKEPTYMTLVALQTFSGQWMLSAEFSAVMNSTLVALQSAAPIKALDVWATVLALSSLEVKFGDKRDEWEMMETKARRWLDLQDLEGLSIDDLLQKAKAVINQS